MATRPVSGHEAAAASNGSLAHQIARKLEEAILTGERALGERLDERDLAEQFKASRTPVREALQRLAASGLVVLHGRQGARVARLTLVQLLDAFKVVGELEAIAAEQAARRITPGQVQALEAHQGACDEAATAHDILAFCEANRQFHDGILAASGNWMLGEQMRSARLLSPYRNIITAQPGRMTHSIVEHRAILDAILDGRGADAAEVMRRHVNALGHGVSDFLHYLSQSGGREILEPSD